MLEPTDVQIRKAIAQTIRVALARHYNLLDGEGKPDPTQVKIKVHDHWILSHRIGESASMMIVEEGTEEGLLHGWMVGLAGVTRQKPASAPNMQGNHRLYKVNPNRRDVLRTYRVWCYHQLDTGVAGEESDNNSENRLASEIEAVADEFSNNPKMGIENTFLMGHQDLQFSPIDTFSFGDRLANVAQGTLSVVLEKPIR